jgi:hypothetical protein
MPMMDSDLGLVPAHQSIAVRTEVRHVPKKVKINAQGNITKSLLTNSMISQFYSAKIHMYFTENNHPRQIIIVMAW